MTFEHVRETCHMRLEKVEELEKEVAVHQQRRDELTTKVLRQEEKMKSLESHIYRQKEGITSALNLFTASAAHKDRTAPHTMDHFWTTPATAKPRDVQSPLLLRDMADVEMHALQSSVTDMPHHCTRRERNNKFERLDSEIASLNAEIKRAKASYP